MKTTAPALAGAPGSMTLLCSEPVLASGVVPRSVRLPARTVTPIRCAMALPSALTTSTE